MTNPAENFWRKCSSCKKPIAYGAKHYVCSVSTCNGLRTGYAFCSVPCFEVHLPGARHKDAAAIEALAPKTATPTTTSMGAEPKRSIIREPMSGAKSGTVSNQNTPKEVLIIASRLKDYIHARADMNTSTSVMDVLSDHVRIICDRATENARADGRKTVMDRDFAFLSGPLKM